MKNSVFFNFIFLLLVKHKSKHFAIFLISIFIVFLTSSILFIKNSLQKEISQALENQSDFIIQKTIANKIKDIDTSLIDEFYEINGVSKVTQRVYGQYYFMPENVYFTIIGIDFFEETTNQDLKELLNFLNISKFLEKDSMIIGNGVKKVLDKYAYFDSYDFKLENENSKNIKIFKDLPKEANLVANDLIIMDINIAKKILDIKPDFATDIVLDVPNPLERQNVKEQILLKESNIRILQKDELKKEYENMFNYKGGIFLILFIVVIFTFILVLYQRYSMISSNDKREIGILKAVGWSIKDIIKLKIIENFIVAFMAFIIGVIFAYIFVFILQAPILKNIFIGFSNIKNDFILNQNIKISNLITLFLFFMVPFLSAVLIPVWKIAVIDATKSMK
ncbi:ABC transporter permease [Aliarcobacter butzleri]|uniref:ABC transporter permease n=1 Tax=Aliarcobacter butzleri TaxID=28197 RepID=UPI00125EDBB8|nr:FtsX-like permease family protein [Aliarcobacter butzleri]MCT7594571.1 ABC transporter permease [Aliarcobacter butzleri]MCT7599195.1 ABC transporter permease [Aliarcobacter butzleri]MCT7652623.1 ABC transporter permease [Aliarcobacter butzleri]MDN5044822.1 FtsX-like permease family protein [Aliarcobacter butzleri]UXC29142.1 ABC transporter permease [Aliarcobacter butzleri]